MELNKYQTRLSDELKEKLPKEVWDDIIEFISTVPFISFLIGDEKIRGLAKDKPRYNELADDEDTNYYNDNRIVVDITHPHILEDMDFFRERAIFFDKHGKYTNITVNPNPKSEYADFWRKELHRWKYGLIRESDGEWIPGGLYFYWNYSPIWLVKKDKATGKGERKRDFPRPWLGDYLFYHYIEQATITGQHGKLLKCRGIGFSYKSGSMSPRNMYILPGTGNPNFHLASDKTFLTGDKGVYGKVIDCLDWIADNTPFPKIRLQDGKKEMVIQLGFTDEYGVRRGLLSSVTGISLKDNPDKARGIRGPYIQYEEDGLFKNLEKAWNVNRKAVEDGGVTSGFMLAGGCLTKNNYVWSNNGKINNITEITKATGIVGFKGDGLIKEKIEWFKEPEEKECVRITTSGGDFIECSTDHPILWSKGHWRKRKAASNSYLGKFCTFKNAGDIKVGDQLIKNDTLNIFGTKHYKHARLYGLMIGDGNLSINASPSLSCGDEEVFNFIKDNYNYTVSKKFKTKAGGIYRQVGLSRNGDVFKDSTLVGLVKLEKRLPSDIHKYNKESLANLLGGYYEADGNVNYNEKRNNIRVVLTSISKPLLLEVKQQLVKFGIHGNIVKEFRKEGYNLNTYIYRLYITSYTDVKRFQNNISFLTKRKQETLDKIKVIKWKDRTREKNYYFTLGSNNKGAYFVNRNKEITNTRHEAVSKVEFIGKKVVYNLHTLYSNTYLANNFITKQTGGTEGANFEGSEKLFYKPNAYNIYGIPNVYDRNANSESVCGFFWGAYLNRNECYDISTGEPDVIKALVEVLLDRYKVKYSSSDTLAITQKKAEECITPQEAVMRTEGTVFPVAELKEYLESIAPNLASFTAEHYVGTLIYDIQGKVIWKPTQTTLPLRSYDVSVGDRTGAVEIFEMPRKNDIGEIISGRYIAGIDPIDADRGPSLFSMLVMDTFTDRIVAEYSGRPRTANEAYEICLKLLKFYNAVGNYESNLKGLFSYFDRKNALQYLCNVPQILKDMELVKDTSAYGNLAKGTRAGAAVNMWGRSLQADWMKTPAHSNKEEDERLNLHRLRGIAYIEEAIKWNSDGNFDRISAGIMLFILREERFKRISYMKKNQFNKIKELSEDDYFTRNFNNKTNNAAKILYEANKEYLRK